MGPIIQKQIKRRVAYGQIAHSIPLKDAYRQTAQSHPNDRCIWADSANSISLQFHMGRKLILAVMTPGQPPGSSPKEPRTCKIEGPMGLIFTRTHIQVYQVYLKGEYKGY